MCVYAVDSLLQLLCLLTQEVICCNPVRDLMVANKHPTVASQVLKGVSHSEQLHISFDIRRLTVGPTVIVLVAIVAVVVAVKYSVVVVEALGTSVGDFGDGHTVVS